VRKNQLDNLPSFLGSCAKLRVLDVSFNILKQFPVVICSLTSLVELYLQGNQLPRFLKKKKKKNEN